MKAKVAAEITDSIVRNTETEPRYIYVVVEDVAPSVAGEGKLFGEPAASEGSLTQRGALRP